MPLWHPWGNLNIQDVAKMAAANKNNIKTAITSQLIYLGMYFLAPIVCLTSQGIVRMCPICIQCCKSKICQNVRRKHDTLQ